MSQSTLFIPDISGFTKFVKSTEIRHSKHIVEELINIIIKKGSGLFEVAEIEGDAVFFYNEKKVSTEELVTVARKIFRAFHKHISYYENGRICNCGACLQAFDLKLKFIVHSGEISLAKFESQKAKPYGDAVITVHRLLKNKIDTSQYILFTEEYLGDSEFQFDGDGKMEDASLGTVPYKYLQIDHWKKDLITDVEEVPNGKVDLTIEASSDIPLDSEVLLQLISDFRYRHLWSKDVDRIIYDDKEINQAGTNHYCIVNGKDLYFNTIKPKARPDILTYGEVLKNPTPLKYLETNFLLTPSSIKETSLKFIIRASVKWKFQLLFLPVIRRKMKQQAMEILKDIKEAIPNHQKELAEIMA